MKNKKVWITIAVIAVIIIVLVWGSKTNWWGLGKNSTVTIPTSPNTRTLMTNGVGARWIEVPRTQGGTCPVGAGLGSTFNPPLSPEGPGDKCFKSASSSI